jgi:hypothetical protein
MGLIGMRDIDKGVSDAPGIKLVIYIMKILYFNHSTSSLSNNFGLGGRTNYVRPLQTHSQCYHWPSTGKEKPCRRGKNPPGVAKGCSG